MSLGFMGVKFNPKGGSCRENPMILCLQGKLNHNATEWYVLT